MKETLSQAREKSKSETESMFSASRKRKNDSLLNESLMTEKSMYTSDLIRNYMNKKPRPEVSLLYTPLQPSKWIFALQFWSKTFLTCMCNWILMSGCDPIASESISQAQRCVLLSMLVDQNTSALIVRSSDYGKSTAALLHAVQERLKESKSENDRAEQLLASLAPA